MLALLISLMVVPVAAPQISRNVRPSPTCGASPRRHHHPAAASSAGAPAADSLMARQRQAQPTTPQGNEKGPPTQAQQRSG